jgi:hypothetical protein
MATLINGMPYPYGINFQTVSLEMAPPSGNEPLNSSNEHVHNQFSSSAQNAADATGQNAKNLWQTRDDLKLTGHYSGGWFYDYNDFDILKWGRSLYPGFAPYIP